MSHTLLRASLLVGALALASPAFATPVVNPGAKPGAAASWVWNGSAVTLTLAPGYDAAEVAKAIGASVKNVTAKAEGGKVVVSGLGQDQLFPLLEKIEVNAGGDDVDGLLANMHQPGGGGEDESSGSSVRASKATDFSAVMGAKEEQITAKVVSVQRQQYPLVLVTVKVDKVPKSVTLPGVKSGAKLTVLPRVKSKNGVIDPSDSTSKLNVGAWYAQPGDVVQLRLEKDPKDNVWIAAAFDRHAAK